MAQPTVRCTSYLLAASKIRSSRAAVLRQSAPSSIPTCQSRTITTTYANKCTDPSFSSPPRRARASRSTAALLSSPANKRDVFRARQRPFSSTTPSRATVVLQNPRMDEDGKDMTIEISPRAAKRLQQITAPPPPSSNNTASPMSLKSPTEHSHLRVTVTSGGCHGFQYLMSLEPASKVDAEEDTVFASQDITATADRGENGGKAEVAMDSASLELLKGSTIDFTQELIGSQFKIVGNPRAKSSCGCGTSFDVD